MTKTTDAIFDANAEAIENEDIAKSLPATAEPALVVVLDEPLIADEDTTKSRPVNGIAPTSDATMPNTTTAKPVLLVGLVESPIDAEDTAIIPPARLHHSKE